MAERKSPSIERNRRTRKKKEKEAARAQFFFKKQSGLEKFIGMQKIRPKSSSKTGRASQKG